MGTYKRSAGSRQYGTSYTQEALRKALDKCRKGWSLLKASKVFSIPYGTLHNKYHGKHTRKTGGQPRLSDACQAYLLKTIDLLTEWKVPLDGMDIRLLVKQYLDALGVNDKRFKNNYPGKEWLMSFVRRHRPTRRIADNVKPARAEVSRDDIITYFKELAVTLRDVPASNLFNYDETNVSDDPAIRRSFVGEDYGVWRERWIILRAVFQSCTVGVQMECFYHRWWCTVLKTVTQSGQSVAHVGVYMMPHHLVGSTVAVLTVGSIQCSCIMSRIYQDLKFF